jgi:hypothetical protein
MKRSRALKSRVREVEEGSGGAGLVKMTFADGSSDSVILTRNDRLKVLLASFDVSVLRVKPDHKVSSTPRAREIAKLVGKALSVSPASRLWGTVSSMVQGASEDGKNDGEVIPE